MIPIDTLYYYSELILGIGLLIVSLEYLFNLRDFEHNQAFDWKIIGSDYLQKVLPQRLQQLLYSKNGVMGLMTIRISAILFLLAVPYGSALYLISLFLTLITTLIYYYRQSFGLDGADQMVILTSTTILIVQFVFGGDKLAMELGAWFLGSQLLLSYAVSGYWKLFSVTWRNGTASEGILSTYTYGTEITRKLFVNNKALNLFFCWMIIVTECVFPFCIFLGSDWILLCIAAGVLFHVGIAVVMGLNDFVWGFASTYPSLYFISQYFN